MNDKELAEQYDSDGYYVPYGSTGNLKMYQRCSVCYQKTKTKRVTTYYCSCCRLAICSTDVVRSDENGNRYICWNVLHKDPVMIEKSKQSYRKFLESHPVCV